MKQYKRNQVEDALSQVFSEPSEKPSAELRTRIKRLLNADRSLGHDPKSSDPEKSHYAFFSDESPGRGVDVMFTEYEAFALCMGLSILQHGWPQGFAVKLLRRLRCDLERQHAEIVKEDATEFLGRDQMRRDADGPSPPDDEPYLVIVTDGGRPEKFEACAVKKGHREAWDFAKQNARLPTWTTYDLERPAHSLAAHLKAASARKRGRGG